MRYIEPIRNTWRAVAHGRWLHFMHELHTDAALSTREENNQRLRVQRFLLASMFSLLYVVVLAIYYTQDKVDRDTLIAAFAIVLVAILLFFTLFRLHLNLRFRDPSLTAPQVLAAVCTMLFVIYRAPETRTVFAAFFFVALMFGMLRSSARQLAILGFLSLAGFGLVAGLRYAANHDAAMLRLDMLQLGVTAITFPWLVFIGSRVKQLKEADRRKDDFLATLAHELRNPLAPISTGIHLLRATVADPRAQSTLPMIERQLKHLTRLLDDLLDVSRITRGKISLHIERIDLRGSVQAAVEATRSQFEQLSHELTLSMPSQPVWLHADPVRLAQVFSNLLNNAAKYTQRGGRIALKVAQHAGMVEISVSDDGIGIRRERLEHVFDMFTQIGSPAQQPQTGLGIGLSLVRSLVSLHGGTIEAHSDGPGRGSEFRIRLPMTVAARSRSAAIRTSTHEGRRKLNVLVVDDNRDAASSLAALVELMGHEVRIAHDGDTAVRAADEFRPQAILLDLGMPGMDGYEACRRIRRHAWGKETMIVAVTGWGQEEDRRKSSAAGFNEHLVKPVMPENIEQLLGDVRSPA